jgi:hypothetical protein
LNLGSSTGPTQGSTAWIHRPQTVVERGAKFCGIDPGGQSSGYRLMPPSPIFSIRR